jgi:ATP-dependent DNA ligase
MKIRASAAHVKAIRKKARSSTGTSPAHFIESMECLHVAKLPQGPEWSYEVKLDGFRLEAVKQNGTTTLFSRHGNILNRKFHYIATALQKLPDNTVLDGELVALDSKGKTDFGLLQNFLSRRSGATSTIILKASKSPNAPLLTWRKRSPAAGAKA